MDCLFCKIISGELGTDLVYEDEHIVGFNDIDPKAPHHVLFIPRQHIATINDITEEHNVLIGQMVRAAKLYAQNLGIAEAGYRLLFNCNEGGGQAVFHIHLHLLGGRQMLWPPG